MIGCRNYHDFWDRRMLDYKLKEHAQSNIYPFHMPGHKRKLTADMDAYAIDITEIDGFDNLHHAEDIIKEAQQRAADLYGVKKSYYLVNGSTCGLLAAICAATERRGEILVARNCHKAVYHSIYLQELTPHYLYPDITQEGIACAIKSSAVKKALEDYPNVQAVLITSPTYDGVVSDIAEIAEVVHENGIPLIVDEAHGAHFGLTEQLWYENDSSEHSRMFPDSAAHCGADLVIQSLHKTLPSLTQTALLHICTDRALEKEVERYLDIFETSSPSYVFMAGMERCIRMMAEDGEMLLNRLRQNLHAFCEKMKELKHLRLLTAKDFLAGRAYDFDTSKILIYTGNTNITGKELYDRLLKEYGLQLEMASGNYALAMASVMDTKDGFDRLAEALFEIDETVVCSDEETFPIIYTPQEQICSLSEAIDGAHELLSLEAAKDRVAADYIYLYPPGIPLLAPGERITQKIIDDICACREVGFTVHGLLPDNRIEVVNF